jgi:hypothetical protein
MSKTLIIGIVIAVVGIFAALGFILWQDVRNQVSHTPAQQISGDSLEEELSIKVSKDQYYPDEQVRVTISNNSSAPISYKGSLWSDIEWQKQNQETWKNLMRLDSGALGECEVISIDESIDLPVYSHPLYPKVTEAGAYRFIFHYSKGASCENPQDQVISKEFRVVEKFESVAAFCQSKELQAWEVVSLSANQGEAREYAVVCGRGVTHPSGEFEYDRRYLYILDEQSNYASVLWEGDLLRLLGREVYVSQVVDVDADGIEEIVISGFDWGSPPCPASVVGKLLYSVKYNEVFHVLESSVSEISSFSEECIYKDLVEFSENLEREEYSVFKEYLINKE